MARPANSTRHTTLALVALLVLCATAWAIVGAIIGASTERPTAGFEPLPAARAPTSGEPTLTQRERAPAGDSDSQCTAAASDDAWLARFVVVDATGRPLPDATIRGWPPLDVNSTGDVRAGVPLFVVTTGARGRAARAVLVDEIVASATVSGRACGDVEQLSRWSDCTELCFVLPSDIRVRGVVLAADGTPAAGAEVTATVHRTPDPHRSAGRRTQKASTDLHGRFELPLQLGVRYHVDASHGPARTFPAWLTAGAETEPLTLRCKGAYSVRGDVVNPVGAATTAMVWVWPELPAGAEPPPEDEPVMTGAQTDGHGRFTIAVPGPGRYHVLAVDGDAGAFATGRLTTVATTADAPHTDVQLSLLAYERIAGRLRRGDGTPLANIDVDVEPSTPEPAPVAHLPVQLGQFSAIRGGLRTTSDGSFEFRVHPDTPWTLIARVHRWDHCAARMPGVAPGRTNVVWTVDDAALATCEVHGVLTGAGADQVTGGQVELLSADGAELGNIDASFSGPRFTLQPLPTGRTFVVRVWPSRRDVARQRCPPGVSPAFTTDGATADVAVAMVWHHLRLRVHDRATTRRVLHAVVRPVDLPSRWAPFPQRIDDDGGLTWPGLGAGPHVLTVLAGDCVVHRARIDVGPGLGAEHVVHLGGDTVPGPR